MTTPVQCDKDSKGVRKLRQMRRENARQKEPKQVTETPRELRHKLEPGEQSWNELSLEGAESGRC